MVLYPILLSQSWSATVPNSMLVSGIAQSSQNLALSLLAMSVFVCFVALHPKSTAMVMVGRSVHLTTLFPGQA